MAHATPAQPQTGLGTSIIRTLVPLVVGVLTDLAARWLGVDLPAGPLGEVVTLVIAGVYYTGVRLLEEYVSPVWGRVLLGLGLRSKPRYEPAA